MIVLSTGFYVVETSFHKGKESHVLRFPQGYDRFERGWPLPYPSIADAESAMGQILAEGVVQGHALEIYPADTIRQKDNGLVIV